ncbi:MAG TPA: hypothetical protein VHB69_15315 [Mycobacteriales bacterium]|nr:hypothetical protein [Mycobacteriales bacterium]
MSEALSDALSTLREKAPSLPSHLPSAAKDATDAVRSHLPNVDVDAVRSHLPSLKDVDPSAVISRLPRKRMRMRWGYAAVLLGAVATGAAAFGVYRHRAPAANDASIYTPPLPKP